MRVFGLIGYPLAHSWSALYFNEKFRRLNLNDHIYKLFPIGNPREIRDIIRDNPGIEGLNVTIPYKISVLSYLDHLSPVAREIAAVNCIRISYESGRILLTGYNTDVTGFEDSIKPFLKTNHRKALVLGTGGASRAVTLSLTRLGIECTLVSRNPSTEGVLSYKDITPAVIAEHQVIINATPVGMFPDILEYPDLPYRSLGAGHLLFDLVYNPEETVFLRKGLEAGAQVINGIRMLELQAEASWRIWNR